MSKFGDKAVIKKYDGGQGGQEKQEKCNTFFSPHSISHLSLSQIYQQFSWVPHDVIFKAFRSYPISIQEELYQDAILYLLESCKTYDETKGASFSSYAWSNIRFKILTKMRGSFKTAGAKIARLIWKFEADYDYLSESDRYELIVKHCKEVGIKESDVYNVYNTTHVGYLDENAADYISDGYNLEHEVMSNITCENIINFIKEQKMFTGSDKYKAIIDYWVYCLSNEIKFNFRECGEICGCSKQSVSSVICSIRNKLKIWLEENDYVR